MQALHHVEIKVVSQVHVFYVSLCGNMEVEMCMCIYVFKYDAFNIEADQWLLPDDDQVSLYPVAPLTDDQRA